MWLLRSRKCPGQPPNILETLQHEARAFIGSFTHDYEQIGDIHHEAMEGFTDIDVSEPLSVWIGMGRDQAQSLKQMIEDSFTPETGIPVHLQLISGMQGLLIPATIAGTAPDVAIGASNMELAFRDAVQDLTVFPDF